MEFIANLQSTENPRFRLFMQKASKHFCFLKLGISERYRSFVRYSTFVESISAPREQNIIGFFNQMSDLAKTRSQ